MTVLVNVKFQGDIAKFRQSLADRASEFEKWSNLSRASGCVHHRFGIGDGFVAVDGEWESVDDFQQFFANPELQAFIAQTGAAPGPPEVTVSEAVASSDQF
jgi:hypothetical protein